MIKFHLMESASLWLVRYSYSIIADESSVHELVISPFVTKVLYRGDIDVGAQFNNNIMNVFQGFGPGWKVEKVG